MCRVLILGVGEEEEEDGDEGHQILPMVGVEAAQDRGDCMHAIVTWIQLLVKAVVPPAVRVQVVAARAMAPLSIIPTEAAIITTNSIAVITTDGRNHLNVIQIVVGQWVNLMLAFPTTTEEVMVVVVDINTTITMKQNSTQTEDQEGIITMASQSSIPTEGMPVETIVRCDFQKEGSEEYTDQIMIQPHPMVTEDVVEVVHPTENEEEGIENDHVHPADVEV